jgi:hypothetical protein
VVELHRVSWSKRFDVPIALPNGESLATLDDARRHLLALPKSRHQNRDVEAAIEAVMMAAENRGPMMHANRGIGLVVFGPKPIPEPRPPTRHWGRRKPARER